MSSRSIFVQKFRSFLHDHHSPSHIRVILGCIVTMCSYFKIYNVLAEMYVISIICFVFICVVFFIHFIVIYIK